MLSGRISKSVPVRQPADTELRCENPQLAYHLTPPCNMYCVVACAFKFYFNLTINHFAIICKRILNRFFNKKNRWFSLRNQIALIILYNLSHTLVYLFGQFLKTRLLSQNILQCNNSPLIQNLYRSQKCPQWQIGVTEYF